VRFADLHGAGRYLRSGGGSSGAEHATAARDHERGQRGRLPAGIVANSWVTIQGTNLAQVTDDWSHSIVNGALPTSLDGVSVTMGAKPAFIYYISPGQLNVLAPSVPAGPLTVTVTTPGGSGASFSTTASLYGPAFFVWPGGQVVATRQDYSYAVNRAHSRELPRLRQSRAKSLSCGHRIRSHDAVGAIGRSGAGQR